MRRNITIIVCLLLLCGCSKSSMQFTPLSAFEGVWRSNAETITVDAFGQTVAITFAKQIASPIPGSITLPYTYTPGDTVWCYSGSIYPDMYFYMQQGMPMGMIEEVAEGPGKGQFKPLVRL